MTPVQGWEWLPPYIDEVSDRLGLSRAEVFRRAFCETFGDDCPELEERYRAYRKAFE